MIIVILSPKEMARSLPVREGGRHDQQYSHCADVLQWSLPHLSLGHHGVLNSSHSLILNRCWEHTMPNNLIGNKDYLTSKEESLGEFRACLCEFIAFPAESYLRKAQMQQHLNIWPPTWNPSCGCLPEPCQQDWTPPSWESVTSSSLLTSTACLVLTGPIKPTPPGPAACSWMSSVCIVFSYQLTHIFLSRNRHCPMKRWVQFCKVKRKP